MQSAGCRLDLDWVGFAPDDDMTPNSLQVVQTLHFFFFFFCLKGKLRDKVKLTVGQTLESVAGDLGGVGIS